MEKRTEITSVFYSELIKLWFEVQFILAFQNSGILEESFPNHISAFGTQDDVHEFLNTSRNLSRGYLSSILRSTLRYISAFCNLELSRIFGYLSTFGICQFTNVIFVKSIICGPKKVPLSHQRYTLQTLYNTL